VQKSRHAALAVPAELEGGGGHVRYGFPVLVREGLREVRQYAAKKNVDTQPACRDSIVAIEAAPAPGEAIPGGEAGAEGSPRAAADRLLPNARDLLWRCLLFPLYPSLTRKDVSHISKVLSTLP
jgi:perosamine synthetase